MELGKASTYESTYNPQKLFAISRDIQRATLEIGDKPPFFGYDIWNHYEVSWLNAKGKPVAAMATFHYSSDSKNIIESKSLKLYFNTLNNTRFESIQTLTAVITQDLSACVESHVAVQIIPLEHAYNGFSPAIGNCIDHIDIEVDEFNVNPDFLITQDNYVNETIYSNLLKSNCLVTGQPDWGTIWIDYEGNKISHAGLLQYIVSFRNHQEFHEHCVERIFTDIMRRCSPEVLTVGARYTRRGGIDINPVRSTHPQPIFNDRKIRQ